MPGICLAAGALHAFVATTHFTLAWTHSIEKTRWEEDYLVAREKLHLVEARIRGFGAGMEPPAGAVLRNGVWHYHPAVREIAVLSLARSGYTPDYELCTNGVCRTLADWIPISAGVTKVRPCSE